MTRLQVLEAEGVLQLSFTLHNISGTCTVHISMHTTGSYLQGYHEAVHFRIHNPLALLA